MAELAPVPNFIMSLDDKAFFLTVQCMLECNRMKVSSQCYKNMCSFQLCCCIIECIHLSQAQITDVYIWSAHMTLITFAESQIVNMIISLRCWHAVMTHKLSMHINNIVITLTIACMVVCS